MNSTPASSLELKVIAPTSATCDETDPGTVELDDRPVGTAVAKELTNHLLVRGEYAAARADIKEDDVVRGVSAVKADAGTATSFPKRRA